MADDQTPISETPTDQTQPPVSAIDSAQPAPLENQTVQQPTIDEAPQSVPQENPQVIPAEQNPQTDQQNIPETKPQINISDLSFPFYGSVSPSLVFGAVPNDEAIKQKFKDWAIVGHNGIDFPLAEGTEVLTCDSGKVIQSGDNGDYGNTVTIQHSWGQSFYAHLSETKVNQDQEVKATDLIGLSGQTGAGAFGPHLHFAVKPNSPDNNNGYLGFINPSPYLKNEVSKPEASQTNPVQQQPSQTNEPPKPVQEKPAPPPPVSNPPVDSSSSSLNPSSEPTINIEPINLPTGDKPVQKPPTSETKPDDGFKIEPQPTEPTTDRSDVQKQVDEKLKIELEARRLSANQARIDKREEHLKSIEQFLSDKKEATNAHVRDLLHVSQTTATRYLQRLVQSGRIKSEGKGKATVYKNIFG